MNELERGNSAIQAPRTAEAVVAGHICLDVIPTLVGGGVVFMPGQTVEAGPAVFATGGPVSNTGLALHKLGVSTRLMGKAGDDLFGQAILQIIESHGPGLAEGMVVVPGEYSSYSIILSSPNELAAQAKGSRPLDQITPDMFSELGQALLDMGAKIAGLKAGERGL